MGFFSQLFKRSEGSSSASYEAPVVNVNADVTLYAPVSGSLMPLGDVPDIVISEMVMGEGVAVVPESESVVAPCDGIISRLLPTKNAFAVRMENGLEVYVSFGVESMETQGEGFTVKMAIGDEVKKGDVVLIADLRTLSQRLKSTIVSMIVIRSSGKLDKVVPASGKVTAGQSAAIWINLKH